MRIEQNLLRRNPTHNNTNGHHHHNGNGLHNNNNNSLTPTTATNNKRNQGKEVGQDIPVRKSTLQEAENDEKTSFLNPELQRELNRILAEAEGDGKLSEDSSVSGCSSSSASSSEEDDDYEHPRRLFLEEIAEEDEEDLEEDEEEEEVEDEEELDDEQDEDEDENDISESEEEVEHGPDDGPESASVEINSGEQAGAAVDDTNELEPSSDFASDSDATITNEAVGVADEEIETVEQKQHHHHYHQSNPKMFQASRQFRREHEIQIHPSSHGKQVERILLKVENVDYEDDDDGQSAVENEWGKRQIDEGTVAEHARGETGISTEVAAPAYGEPVVMVGNAEQQNQNQNQQHEPYSNSNSSHSHKKSFKEATLECEEEQEHKQDRSYPQRGGSGSSNSNSAGESVTEVVSGEQPQLKFLQREEHSPAPAKAERNSDTAYSTPPYTRSVDECYEEDENEDEEEGNDENDKDVEFDDDDDDDDEDEDDSDSSSIGGFQELEQKRHEHVEIRLFHDVDGSSSSSSSGSGSSSGSAGEEELEQDLGTTSRNPISRDWTRPVLVDLEQASTAEVHESVPESPGESGTGSSSPPPPTSPSASKSAPTPPSSQPLKSGGLSFAQPNSSYLSRTATADQGDKTSNKNVSEVVRDSYCNSFNRNSSTATTTTTAPPPPPLPPLPISSNISNYNNASGRPPVRIVASSLKNNNPTVSVTSSPSSSSSLLPNPNCSPSILVTSPKTSPSSDSGSSSSSSTSSGKLKKRVSFHEQIESKTYCCSDEPSSVSSSVSDFNPSRKDDSNSSVIIVSSLRKRSRSSSNSSSSDLTVAPTTSTATTTSANANSNANNVEQELNPSFISASQFYNNCQFSTADFWAVRNGAGESNGTSNQHQYIQSFYYSESDNAPAAGEELYGRRQQHQQQHQQQQLPPQQLSRQPNNNHYYYPTEYFTLSDSQSSPQNSSLGLPPAPPAVVVESSSESQSQSQSSISGKQFWSQGQNQSQTQPSHNHNQEQEQQQQQNHNHHQPARTPAGVVLSPPGTKTSGVAGASVVPSSPSTISSTSTTAGAPSSSSPSTRPTSLLDNNRNAEMHQRLSGGEQRLRSVLRKPGVGGVKKTRGERSVTFNESLNLFYEAECSCWIHEDYYHRMRAEEQAAAAAQAQQQQQQHQHHQHQHHQHHQQFIYEQTHPHFPHTHHHPHQQQNFIYEPPPIEFEDPPTLSPPEGYKDRFFPQEDPTDPDVTRVTPPSPPSARRKVFLKENSTDQIPQPPPQPKGVILNGLEDEEEDEESKKGGGGSNTSGSKGSRLGGILKGGRLWRSNSAEGKKVTSPPDEPDVVKCTERDSRERLSEKDPSADRPNSVSVSSGPSSPQNQVQTQESYQQMPTKVSTGTAPLRTSEQIRLAVDSTLRLRTKKKPECSSLVEKLRWLTSLDDDDPSSDSSQSGFATWPSRDKNGSVSSTSSSSKKSDAGTSTNEEFVNSAGIRQPPPIYSSSEAKIKQISYTLEDIDEGLKGSEIELESFITEDGGRIERLKKRYSGEEPGDDYGFSRRPSVKGIKPKFSSTNQIFAQYTAMRASGTETPVPVESQYENTRGLPPPANFDQIPNHLDGARMQLNYDLQNATGRPPEESRAHFEMIRQSFEHAASFSNFNRPHSWSVSTLPHPHHAHAHSNSVSMGTTSSPIPPTSAGGGMPPNLLSNNFGSSLSVSQPMQQQQQQQQQQNNLSMNPSPINMNNAAAAAAAAAAGQRGPDGVPMMAGNPAQIYGTLPSQAQLAAQQAQMAQQGQAIYGTVRRVPNVIGRPLFLHYGALSVEAHPNKIVQPSFPRPTKVPETPSPTQQPPPLRYYGPPIRYYNSPPPVPPRSVTTAVSASGQPIPSGNGVPNQAMTDCQQERGVPEGATDEEPSLKESYSMNV